MGKDKKRRARDKKRGYSDREFLDITDVRACACVSVCLNACASMDGVREGGLSWSSLLFFTEPVLTYYHKSLIQHFFRFYRHSKVDLAKTAAALGLEMKTVDAVVKACECF